MPDAANVPSDAELMREQRLQRNLKILVTGLGLLMVLGLMGIGYRMTTLTPPASPASATSTTPFATLRGDIAVDLPAGAKVVSISLSGNRLAIHHESTAGTGISIIDLETGRRIAGLKLQAAIPGN